MRFVFITNNFPPVSCGVGDYTYNLSNEFIKKGHEVVVISSSNRLIKEAANNQLKVYPIGGSWGLKQYKNVIKLINDINPHHVMLQYVPGSFNRYSVPWFLLYFCWKLKRNRISIITTFHETYVRFSVKAIKYLYVSVGQRIIAFAISKISDRLITSIERYENQLKYWNPNVKVIPIGSNILPDDDISEIDILRIREQLKFRNAPIVSTFGIRDHNQLIKLFQSLKVQIPDAILLICGTIRADLSKCPDTIRKDIFVTGFLESREVFKYLKSSDLFVMLDYVDDKGEGGTCNKSTSLAAAFAAGLPIAATKGDMTNDLLLKRSSINWIDYSNIERAKEKLVSLIERPVPGQGELNRKFYEDYLKWNIIAFKYFNNE